MIDLDELHDKMVSYRLAGFTKSDIGTIDALELLGRLGQAEKDAARYRWLRNDSAFTHENAPLAFFTDTNGDQIAFYFNGSSYSVLHDEMLDAAIDEAMQCNK